MLVPLPIGLWLFSFVCDLIFLLGGGDPIWSAVATYAMAGGLVGALLAAVPGVIDFVAVRRHEAGRVALLHMAINLTVVAVYAVNLYLRVGSDQVANALVWASAFAIGLLVISGWLGGRMVYELGVGVSATEPGPRGTTRSVHVASRET